MDPPSWSAPEDGPDRTRRRRSLGDVMTRVRTVLRGRRGSHSQTSSESLQERTMSDSTEIPASLSIPAPAAVASSSSTSQPPAPTTTTSSDIQLPDAPPSTDLPSQEPAPFVPSLSHPAISSTLPQPAELDPATEIYQRRAARAQALCARWNVPFDMDDVVPPSTSFSGQPTRSDRVERRVRVRVHHRCHRCQSTFGQNPACRTCGHRMCRECSRYPHKRPIVPAADTRTTTTPMEFVEPTSTTPSTIPLAPVSATRATLEVLSRIPENPADRLLPGRPHDAAPPRGNEFTDRFCRACGSNVPATLYRCSNCGFAHLHESISSTSAAGMTTTGRPKRERVFRKAQQRVRWTCDRCSATFEDRNHICPDCGHQRCGECVRFPPRRSKPDPSAEIMQRVTAHFEGASLNAAPPVVAPGLTLVTEMQS